jgi:hypothetical protein
LLTNEGQFHHNGRRQEWLFRRVRIPKRLECNRYVVDTREDFLEISALFTFCSLDSSAGYVVSNKVFNTIVMRYVDKNNHVSFEDYMICVIRLKTVFETYQAHPKIEQKAQFDLDEVSIHVALLKLQFYLH